MSDNDTPLEADSEKRTSFDDLYLNDNKYVLEEMNRTTQLPLFNLFKFNGGY